MRGYLYNHPLPSQSPSLVPVILATRCSFVILSSYLLYCILLSSKTSNQEFSYCLSILRESFLVPSLLPFFQRKFPLYKISSTDFICYEANVSSFIAFLDVFWFVFAGAGSVPRPVGEVTNNLKERPVSHA